MQTDALINFVVFSLALGLGVTVFVLGLLLLLSYLGGWGALTRKYAALPVIDKGALFEEKPQRKAWVGLSSFGNLVVARCFERGLELTVTFPFSPPLFFPWDDVRDFKHVNAIPFPQMDQFMVGGRLIRLSNPLAELAKRKG